MNRIFKAVGAAFAIGLSAFGLSAEEASLTINFVRGAAMTLNFSDSPEISFEKGTNALKIKTATTETVVKAFNNVRQITFDYSQAGIEDVTADADGVIKVLPDNAVALSGFAPATAVTVVNVAGVTVGSYETDSEGKLEISLASLSKDVYIVAAGEELCKIVIK